MRYPASEKAEIIELVEQSHLPAKRTLDKLGIPRATFYRWYDRYRAGGPRALADHRSRPDRVWNRIPDDVRRQSGATIGRPPRRRDFHRQYDLNPARCHLITVSGFTIAKAPSAFGATRYKPAKMRRSIP